MWNTKIDGCFGAGNKNFAQEPSDEERAFDLLTDLRSQGIAWPQLSAAIRTYLASHPSYGVANQMARVKRMMGPWVL